MHTWNLLGPADHVNQLLISQVGEQHHNVCFGQRTLRVLPEVDLRRLCLQYPLDQLLWGQCRLYGLIYWTFSWSTLWFGCFVLWGQTGYSPCLRGPVVSALFSNTWEKQQVLIYCRHLLLFQTVRICWMLLLFSIYACKVFQGFDKNPWTG